MKNQPETTIADCFAGAERNLDLVRHWREALLVGVTKWCADVARSANSRSLAIAGMRTQ